MEEGFLTKNDALVFGTTWVRADLHLHTKADKEFAYEGDENAFVNAYVGKLKSSGIELGVITNHNKFDLDEFRALRKRARREGVGLLPGVELSVNDGANGVHTLIVFSDAWLEDGNDYINQFLGTVFIGKTPAQYENENGRTGTSIVQTLERLQDFNRDFFVVFAHVEARSGLWNELEGGRLEELAREPLIQRYCLGFQKVRTHDKPDVKCRTKVKAWWPNYPAEVEGSDPKSIEMIGRGVASYLKVGDLTFDAVRYALTDRAFRVAAGKPDTTHSHIRAIRFEGGLLDGVQIPFSPEMNCLIGIQGSGKSSVLECIRYALGIPFGDITQDRDYKNDLVPFVLKSGGKVVLEAIDLHGTAYEVRRILNEKPDVYVNGVLHHGVSIRQTVIRNPLYFGQKDLSAAGRGFGKDLVAKLVGESLKPIQKSIADAELALRTAVSELQAVETDADKLAELEAEQKDLIFRAEQFEKHGVKAKLEKQLEFSGDQAFVTDVDQRAATWHDSIEEIIQEAEESLVTLKVPDSKANAAFFTAYSAALGKLQETVRSGRRLLAEVKATQTELETLHDQLNCTTEGLKEEFAQIERELSQALSEQGVRSITPDAYKLLAEKRAKVDAEIVELQRRTAKKRGKFEGVLTAIATLNDAWLEEFRQVQAALNKINGAQSELQITPEFKGDKPFFRQKLEELCKGSGVRGDALDAVVEAYPDFAAIYADLNKAANLAKSKAGAFREVFSAKLAEALRIQIPNLYEVTYHGKPLKSHSLGQRASAMMLFLLSQEDHDLLLIDQPEDDLDSQTVYEEVIKLVRLKKPTRQFIFVTHNANFPVLGDAETVAAFSLSEGAISVEAASIDERACQERIVHIMEGGPEAFARRKAIYEIWKA